MNDRARTRGTLDVEAPVERFDPMTQAGEARALRVGPAGALVTDLDDQALADL